MKNDVCVNEVKLCGNVVSRLLYSHEWNGKKIYKFFISVKRLSGVEDVIRVLVFDELLEKLKTQIVEGKTVSILGEYESYYTIGKKFILSVHANEITVQDASEIQAVNHVVLTGYICKKVPVRKTPRGKTIIDVFVAINYPNKRTAYIPCVVWGETANRVDKLKLGDKVTFVGRAQSRKYNKVYDDKKVEQRMAYEFSVSEYLEEKN